MRIRIQPLPGFPTGQTSRIHSVIARFMAHEGALLHWISESADNSRRFDCDPLEAIQASCLGLPTDLVAELKAVSPYVTIAASTDRHGP